MQQSGEEGAAGRAPWGSTTCLSCALAGSQQGQPKQQGREMDGSRGPVEHAGILVVHPRFRLHRAAVGEATAQECKAEPR